jgi:hypothetical protein
MFKNLPNEVNWIICDFLKDTPKNNYKKCCNEILNISNFIENFRSNIRYNYINYLVKNTLDSKTLCCNILYVEVDIDIGYNEMNDFDIDGIINLQLSQIILHKIKNYTFIVPKNILDKPYIFPFNSNNKIKKSYYDIIVTILALIIFYSILYIIINLKLTSNLQYWYTGSS